MKVHEQQEGRLATQPSEQCVRAPGGTPGAFAFSAVRLSAASGYPANADRSPAAIVSW